MLQKKIILIFHFVFFFSLPLLGETIVVDAKASEKSIMSHEQYHRGAFVGTLLGFGIGHAMQNRYANKGWIFTMLEGGSIVCFVTAEIIKHTSP